jgi:hypothetical protein
MPTRTIIDKIEIELQTGIIGVRMQKQTLDDLGQLLKFEYHRTAIAPGGDATAQMAAVSLHLSAMGFPAPESKDADVLGTSLASLASFRTQKAQEAAEKAALGRR